MGDGYSFFNEGGFDIFGIDLFPEHLGENFDLFLSPYNESLPTWLNVEIKSFHLAYHSLTRCP